VNQGSSYEDHEVVLSDQLASYQVAEPDAEHVALCSHQDEGAKIEWHIDGRTPEQMVECLAKAEHVANETCLGDSISGQESGAGIETICRCAWGTKRRQPRLWCR
jgi:hypothetical protein